MSASLTSRLKNIGIEKLTPMQEALAAAPMPLRAVLLAPTGSGKTIAFALPFVKSLGAAARTEGIKGVILAPTRELARQVADVVRKLAHPDYKTAALYGGHSMITEVNALGGHPDIIVATPGRLLDHIKRGSVDVKNVGSLVLDEYDKSLELGFLADMRGIVDRMKTVRTIILTSATPLAELPPFLGKVPFATFDYSESLLVPDIDFRRVDSPAADKLEALEALLRDLKGERVIVFVNHRDAAERIYQTLHDRAFPVGLYHGGLEQDMRERALILFGNGSTPVLISTDLASRGLDIADTGAVVHYHLPVSPEAMQHRNGRTGRMGAKGRAFVIISDKDKIPDFFPALEQYWPEGVAAINPSGMSTLYFNVGKKEKISRGDIAGYIMQKGGLAKDEVGKIDVCDHCAYVAVPAAKARDTAVALAPHKIKGVRVRVTQLKN